MVRPPRAACGDPIMTITTPRACARERALVRRTRDSRARAASRDPVLRRRVAGPDAVVAGCAGTSHIHCRGHATRHDGGRGGCSSPMQIGVRLTIRESLVGAADGVAPVAPPRESDAARPRVYVLTGVEGPVAAGTRRHLDASARALAHATKTDASTCEAAATTPVMSSSDATDVQPSRRVQSGISSASRRQDRLLQDVGDPGRTSTSSTPRRLRGRVCPSVACPVPSRPTRAVRLSSPPISQGSQGASA